MKRLNILILSGLLALLCHVNAMPVFAEDGSPLVYWKFAEGSGNSAQDLSGHGVTGSVRALWKNSETGHALFFDGTSRTVVSAQLPENLRLGKGSWSLMAWVKPQQFTIESRQNQRRLFAYGSYPKAFFCVDILGTGAISLYQVYQQDGKNLSASTITSTTLSLDRWAHVAIISDRQTATTQIYINGVLRAEQNSPPNFQPDLSVSGEFTVGNGFQNYLGMAEEVKLYGKALTRNEVKAEFAKLKTTFKIVPTASEVADDALVEVRDAIRSANDAWSRRDYGAVRTVLKPLINRTEVESHFRSYAHLRSAQSYVAQNRFLEAREEYSRIAANAAYPQVHRTEAEERVAELARRMKGILPLHDPATTRPTMPALPAVQERIYVSPEGKDTNPGTQAAPLATLDTARERVRKALTKARRGAIEVALLPGLYKVTDTLLLGKEDSGTPNSPVIYRALKPGTVTLYGGTRLKDFKRVTDPAILRRLPEEARGKVVQCDLKAMGITDYGSLAVRGFGQPASPPTLEVYVNQKPMTLARWPNQGFVSPAKLVEPGSPVTGKPSAFTYSDDRHARWTEADDAWLFGYFHYLWADATIRVGKIDSMTKTLTTAKPYSYGGNGMSEEQGIKYYAFNLLEEIDQPGEWYLNRKTGILYLYPPTDLAQATVEISLLSRPMVIGKGVSHTYFEGLKFDLARFDGIVLDNATDCSLVGCTVSRMAGSGIKILGGERDTIRSCDIHTIGRRATEVIGGERATLTPGNHLVINCRIHDFGRIDRTYTPGVQLEGVGNRVLHNLFYNCPSSAMRIEGNDHLIAYNETHDVLQESDDQGAMELFGNPTYRGVVFRNNLFHHLGSGANDKLRNGQAAIRFDDAISGMLVYSNIFYQSANGHFGSVQINSGRDNIIDNNLFVDTVQGISGGYGAGNHVWQTVREGKSPSTFYTNPLYMSRYPEMRTMMQEPGINHVWRNVFFKVGRDMTGNRTALELLANTIATDDPFMDAGKGDFRLKAALPGFDTIGFRHIPVEDIGLYPDAWRP